MTRIYTPSAWFSIFDNPTMYIDDDGRIYSEDEYYKTFRQAMGKIDYASGYIYGNDYLRLCPQPIGKIKVRESDNVTMIYGPDYLSLSAQPILYIRENSIYEASEFYKLFPIEAGYIESDPVPTPSTTNKSSASSRSYSSSGYSGGLMPRAERSDSNFLRNVLIALAVIAILVFAAYYTLTQSEFAKPSIYMLAVATAIALLFSELWITNVFVILAAMDIQMFIYDYITTTAHKTLGIGEVIISFILYPLAIILSYAVPAVILGTVVWLIKRPFLKKKEEKKKLEKEAKEKK